jgi:hypothetical protein
MQNEIQNKRKKGRFDKVVNLADLSHRPDWYPVAQYRNIALPPLPLPPKTLPHKLGALPKYFNKK